MATLLYDPLVGFPKIRWNDVHCFLGWASIQVKPLASSKNSAGVAITDPVDFCALNNRKEHIYLPTKPPLGSTILQATLACVSRMCMFQCISHHHHWSRQKCPTTPANILPSILLAYHPPHGSKHIKIFHTWWKSAVNRGIVINIRIFKLAESLQPGVCMRQNQTPSHNTFTPSLCAA